MRWGIVLVTLAVLLSSGCSKDTEGGGLTAHLMDEFKDGFDGVIAGPNHLYALDGNTAYQIDPAIGEPLSKKPALGLHVDGTTRRAVADNGDIWFTGRSAQRVPLSGDDPVELVMPDGLDATGVAVSGDTGWVLSASAAKAVPFSEDGVAGEPVDVPCEISPMLHEPGVGGNDAVWTYCEEGVARIDTETGEAALTDIGGRPTGLALTSSGVWAARKGTLYAIDPDTGEVTDTVDRPDADKLAGYGDKLWVSGNGVTLHSASDGTQQAGPVGMPKLSDQVGTAIVEMAAFEDRLFVTLNFYGAPLVMVERAG